jgi:hypothetical protein
MCMGSSFEMAVVTDATLAGGQGCAIGTDWTADGPRETISLRPRPKARFEIESPVGDKGLPPVFRAWFLVEIYNPADAAAVRAMGPKLLRYAPDGSPMVLTVTTRRVAHPYAAGEPRLAHPG